MSQDRHAEFHRDFAVLQAALHAGPGGILASPKSLGRVEMIVRRPDVGEREVLEEARLEPGVGVVGDNWRTRGSSKTADGSSHPGMQVNLMNSRVIDRVAGSRERWQLAGDQFFVDLDLSRENLPPGTRLALGSAVLEVTEVPHLGCKKFVTRFGVDAMAFVNSGPAKALCLRGINAIPVVAGTVRQGDEIRKFDAEESLSG